MVHQIIGSITRWVATFQFFTSWYFHPQLGSPATEWKISSFC